MPTYQYACKDCGHAFEQVQSFSDDALTVCPQCEGRLRKVFNAVGVVFKGSGFYRNDSRSDAAAKTPAAAGASSSSEGSSSSDSGSASTGTSTSEGASTKDSSAAPAASPSTTKAPKTSTTTGAGSAA